jgi:L-ascorbate metabolism protein UlaG (beta-lactamase superfamily)
MHVSWLGQNCFKIEGKNATVIIDPLEAKMPKVSADILILPRPQKDRSFLKSEPFVVETPGEFEAKGIFVRAMTAGDNGELVTRIDVDGVRLGHLGSLKKSDDSIEGFLENVDVLMVPTGGGEVLGPTEAAEVVSSIEPRVVIPMHFKTDADKTLQPVEKFAQAMGMSNGEKQSKVSITPKDLPNEETRLIVLE